MEFQVNLGAKTKIFDLGNLEEGETLYFHTSKFDDYTKHVVKKKSIQYEESHEN